MLLIFKKKQKKHVHRAWHKKAKDTKGTFKLKNRKQPDKAMTANYQRDDNSIQNTT